MARSNHSDVISPDELVPPPITANHGSKSSTSTMANSVAWTYSVLV